MQLFFFDGHYAAISDAHYTAPAVSSDINKDWTCKDKDKDLTHKDQDKDLNLVLKDKDFTYSYLLQVAAKPTIAIKQQQ